MTEININEINKRVAQKLIKVSKHPTLPYSIYNYSAQVQYNRLWDAHTKMCRGLILDKNHNIIAKPFPKFFNLNETPETTNLPKENPKIIEKLDGVMGILYPENDLPSIASRGSFTSEFAEWGTRWIRDKGFKMDDFKPCTYVFEIIYPKSKIVVNYKDRKELVLLAVIGQDGQELNYKKEAEELNLPYAQEYDFTIETAFEHLNNSQGHEFEGFVLKYSNNLRVKIKSEDYRRLHKILVGLSAKDVWFHLKEYGSVDNLVKDVPDEFYNWVHETAEKINQRRERIFTKSRKIAEIVEKMDSRKEQAKYINENAKWASGVIFQLLDGDNKKAEETVWKMIKPKAEFMENK